MNETITVLLMWININTGMIPPDELPNLVLTEQQNICLQFGINNKKQCIGARLAGFYNKNNTIYLHTGFDHSGTIDQSRLLHELIHYVQWKNGDGNECRGKLEAQAYRLQDKWLLERNRPPRSDAFTVMMLEAACEDA